MRKPAYFAFALAAALALCAAAALGPAPAAAKVVDSQANGFTVQGAIEIAAPPAKVWDALGHIGAWWDSRHTFSQDSKNLSIELKPGGCWCETLPGGGGVGHMLIINLQPKKLVRLIGALGPMQSFGAAGAMTWTLTAKDDHTVFAWTYDLGGHAPGGLNGIAPAADGVLQAQAERLKRYVETGAP